MSDTENIAAAGWNHVLRDGTAVTVRSICADDAERERSFLQHLSPEFLRYRSLGLSGGGSDTVADELTHVDAQAEVSLVAIATEHHRLVEIGAAHYYTRSDGRSCDCSVTVRDDYQKRGVATLLMQHLIIAAHAQGIRHMYSVDAASCESRHRLAERMGFRRCPDPDDPASVIYELDLEQLPS
jgi:GNAT superfamily N-acetyltransferase